MEPSGRELLNRVVDEAGGEAVLLALADRLSGADLTTLLLEVMRRRTERVSPAEVLRQYSRDRFVRPSDLDLRELRRVEDVMFGALPPGFEVLTLAPVVPLGAHSAVATVDPRKVIVTVRRTEVAADPTNALALEAAVRRRRLLSASPSRPAEAVRLATSQRVTRAALFSGPASFAHFQLLGVVTAGRDTGGREFERRALLEHLRIGVTGLLAAGADSLTLALTCLDEVGARLLGEAREEFAGCAPGVTVVDAPEREAGRGYYYCLCFKIFARFGEAEPCEISDGGFVDWTAQLLGSRKERLLISGHGLDRVALMARLQPDG
jgi:hypothetical protein